MSDIKDCKVFYINFSTPEMRDNHKEREKLISEVITKINTKTLTIEQLREIKNIIDS